MTDEGIQQVRANIARLMALTMSLHGLSHRIDTDGRWLRAYISGVQVAGPMEEGADWVKWLFCHW